jgi:hypothetical protein
MIPYSPLFTLASNSISIATTTIIISQSEGREYPPHRLDTSLEIPPSLDREYCLGFRYDENPSPIRSHHYRMTRTLERYTDHRRHVSIYADIAAGRRHSHMMLAISARIVEGCCSSLTIRSIINDECWSDFGIEREGAARPPATMVGLVLVLVLVLGIPHYN